MRLPYLTSRAVMTALLAGALLAGCGDDDGDDDDDNPQDDAGQITPDAGDAGRPNDAGMDSGTSNMDASTDAAMLGDAGRVNDNQIVGIAKAVNDGEISAGTLASTKASPGPVRTFGMSMVAAHMAANTRQMALNIAPAASEVQAGLTREAMTIMTNLMNAPMGPAFDRLYMESQVTMHEMTLTMIDGMLLRDVMSTALRSELTTTRGEVASHLTMARQILADLGDAGVGDAGATDAAVSGMDGG